MTDLSSVGHEILALDNLVKALEEKARYWADREREAANQRVKWEAEKRRIETNLATYLRKITYDRHKPYHC